MADKSWTFHDALRAVLLFHDGAPWDAAKRKEWLRITGSDIATTKTLCDHVRWIVGGGGTFKSHPASGDTEGPGERLWGARAGHVLTEQDAVDIEEIISEHNEELGESAEAHHRGGLEMLRKIGGDALVNAFETKDQMMIEEITDRALAKLRADNVAKRSS